MIKRLLMIRKVAAFILLISPVLICCNNHRSLSLRSSPLQISDSLPGSCPFMVKDANGNILLSWVRTLKDSSYVLAYTLSEDDGESFQPIVNIPGTTNIHPHPENLPKIVAKPSGELIAIWGAANPNPKNSYAGLIYYTQSFDHGKSWTPVQRLVKDTAGHDQRYFDVDILENGEVGIVWLDDRKQPNTKGSALYFATTDNRGGFQEERRIAESCCECCRVDLVADKQSLHVLYRGIVEDRIRDMVHSISIDGGKTFSAPRRISNDNWVVPGCPHSGPSMTASTEGVGFAWFTGGQPSGVYFTASADNGKTFSHRDTVSSKARHPQITAIDNDMAIAFDEPQAKDNGMIYRIGLERRTAGKKILHGYITSDSTTATYPVMVTIADKLLVACCIKKGDKSFISFTKVSFD